MNGVKNLKVNTAKINAIMGAKIGFGTLVGLSAFMMPTVLGSVIMGGIGLTIIGKAIDTASMKKDDARYRLSLQEEEINRAKEKTEALAAASARANSTPPIARFTSSQPTVDEAEIILQEEQRRLQEEMRRQQEIEDTRKTIFESYTNNMEGIPFMSSDNYEQMQEELHKTR